MEFLQSYSVIFQYWLTHTFKAPLTDAIISGQLTRLHAMVAVRGSPKLRGRPSSSQGHLVTPTRSLVFTRVTFAAVSWAPKAWGGPSSSRGTWCPLHAIWCLHESVSLAVTLASLQFLPIPPAPGLVPAFVVSKYSTESFSATVPLGGWWPLPGCHGFLLPRLAKPPSTNLETPAPTLIYCWWVMMSLLIQKK